MPKYFLLIPPMFIRKIATPITSVMCAGNQPYMSKAHFMLMEPILNVNIANSFRPRVIQPISIMVKFFIIFTSLLPSK